jgi:hypothetical protein
MKEFFASRKVWALVLGLVALFVTGAFVGFPDVQTQMLEVVAPVVVYILSVGLTPNFEGVKSVFTSTRFWALVASLLAATVKQFIPDFPVTEEQMIGAITLFSGYILGKGISHIVPANK